MVGIFNFVFVINFIHSKIIKYFRLISSQNLIINSSSNLFELWNQMILVNFKNLILFIIKIVIIVLHIYSIHKKKKLNIKLDGFIAYVAYNIYFAYFITFYFTFL